MLARAVPKPGALRGRPPAGGCCRTRRAATSIPPTPRPFNQLPGDWRAGWLNLYRFWQEGGFHNVHHIMARKFQQFGPIYREKLGVYESVNIISPRDAATLFQAEGTLPERFSVPPWVAYRDYRSKPYGVLLKKGEAWRSDRLMLNKEVLSPDVVEGFVPLLSEVGEDFVRRARAQVRNSGRECWTADFTHELFRFALESVCHVLFGERLGLLQDFVDPEVQRFIDAVTLMFHTTSPMLYLPPTLLRHLNAKTWRDHVWAWDAIFSQADKCIQNVYRDLRLQRKSSKEYMGILCSLIMQDKLPLDDIKANVTEMMAGGVDTTSMTLQWAMFELARSPGVQEQLRAEVLAAKREAVGDRVKMLKTIRLLKAAIKETLRLHPVAVTLQRYTTQEVVLQDYRIPPKVSTATRSLCTPTCFALCGGRRRGGSGPAPRTPAKPRPTGRLLPRRRWCRSVSTPWVGTPRSSPSRSSSAPSAGWRLAPSTSRGWGSVSDPASAWDAGLLSWRCSSSSCTSWRTSRSKP
ncbi:cholesterol side-chain cleavage enzyme, mitochondrial isoform X2 [Opisthocomus hoazin]|uniref:cholesterol side-chain cleavage enzyme, mitochondrial isoform X2 n=1 Tax=Opisthocomus hoazin TaxID=30419 RepID=UPI003F52D034